MWDVNSLEVVLALLGQSGGVEALNLGPDGTSAVTSSIADGTVRLWNIEDRLASEVASWPTTPTSETRAEPPVGAVAFSPSGDALASAFGDRIALSPISGSGSSWEIPGPGGDVAAVTFGQDGSTLGAAGSGGVIVVDARSGSIVRAFLDAGPADAVAIDDRGEHVAWAGRGAVVASLASGEMQRLVDASFETSDIVFSPDTRSTIALVRGTASVGPGEEDLSPSMVQLFDGETLEPVGAIRMVDAGQHTRTVVALAFDPDGSRLATASEDATVVVWDVSTLNPSVRIVGHTETVNDVAFDPTRNQIATGSSDRTVRIWDADSGAAVVTLRTHGAVSDISYSPDGSYLVATDPSGATTTFIIDTAMLVEEAERRATRSLTPAECETFLPTLSCPIS